MKRLLLLVYLGLVTYAKPSHHHYNDVYPIHPGVGAIYKGPNSETIIEGPDGSVITSEADGGAVGVTGGALVGVANHAAVKTIAQQAVSASAGAYVQTNVVAETPVVVAKAPVVVEPPVIVPVPAPQVVVVPNNQDIAALDGPSGSVIRHGEDAVISGPSSTTIKGGNHVIDIPNIELKTAVIGFIPPVPVVSPGTVFVGPTPAPALVNVPRVVGPIVSSTPGPILVEAPIRPKPVLIETSHPVRPLIDPVPVLIDDTHLRGSTLGTSGPIIVDDSGFLQKELTLSAQSAVAHNSAAVSVQNEVIPSAVVSSTPGVIAVGPTKPDISVPAFNLSPPLIHSPTQIYSTPAAHILGHANEEAISAAIVKNAEAEQAYLSALRYAGYEKALAAEAERRSLEAAAVHASGHTLAGQAYLNPIVTQGNNLISGGVISSTAAPIVVSSTPAPVLVTSLTPTKPDIVSSGGGLVAVGPQIFQANGIVAVTPKPEIVLAPSPVPQIVPVSTGPADVIVSSTIRPDIIDNSAPIVSRPTAILAPSPPEGLGQIVVQSKSVSASEASSHSSSVHSSSSTGIISGPAVLPLGGPAPSDYAEWEKWAKRGYHGHKGFPVHRGFLH